ICQRHVDNDPGVSATSKLFALACRPTPTPISVNSCVVNGVRFVVHSRDECCITQNSGICSPDGKDGEMYYGHLQEILEFSYLSFKVVLFRVKWFDTSNEGCKVKHLVLRNNMTQILTKCEAFKDHQYILATQVKQCFYLEDMARRQPQWKVVEHVNLKKFSDGGVIVVEEDPDVIHFDNSSDLLLSTSLNDLDNATLQIDGQSTEVDAPPDIINLDEDDDIIDDEDALPHDLADSDDEDLVNVDDDYGVEVMLADVARGHDGDGGRDDRPLTHHIPTGCGGCFVNRGKGTRKPNLGGRKAGRLHTRQETRNLGLKKITDDKGPVLIRFEWDDKKTLMPLGEHASYWSNYLGELIREMPLYYPSWQKVSAERKTAIVTKIGIGMPRLPFGMIPGTKPEPLKIAKIGQRARSYADRDPGHLLAFEIRWVFTRDEDRAIYEEMLRLQARGSNTESGVPYTEEEINDLARKGKQRGHLPGVGWVLPGRATDVLIPPPPPPPQYTHNFADVEKLKKKNRCGDDEMADDEDGSEDEEDEEDGDS
ncbi:putative reverse transcriptase domain-containing protein, partial [Tanacetum coccineum]